VTHNGYRSSPTSPPWEWRTIPARLVEETVVRLGAATTQIDLVRFLARQPGGSATLETIVQDLYGYHRRDGNFRTARRLAERTRSHLDAQSCPLRLLIGGNTVRLVVA
jgi:hypothetical protein